VPVRIVITTAGSRGDVAPYTGLARRLDDAGHHTVIATHEPFRAFVESRGIEFAPLAGDPRALMGSAQGQRWQRAGTGPLATARLVRLMRPYAREMAEKVMAAAEGADLLLCSALTSAGYHTAEGLGIPSMGVYLQPLEPTRAFSTVLAGGTRDLGPWGNRASGTAAEAALAVPFMSQVNQARATMSLPRTTYRAFRRQQRAREWPVLHGFSRHVVPRPPDWRRGLDVVGYWWPEREPEWTPPPELADFLAAGDPPVVIGFGSMAAGTGDAERLAQVAIESLRRLGVRGILQAGWSGLAASGDDVLSIGETPHEWLFPRVAAVVHHAGAGTTAAGLRHGIPAVPVPLLADQPFWAARLRQLGVAAEPVPLPRLTADSLSAALHTVLADPGYRSRAQALACRIADEDGAGAVVAAVERL
jgi:UDP:flavonoid glycosyltransferase YjiC (YdhE family)